MDLPDILLDGWKRQADARVHTMCFLPYEAQEQVKLIDSDSIQRSAYLRKDSIASPGLWHVRSRWVEHWRLVSLMHLNLCMICFSNKEKIISVSHKRLWRNAAQNPNRRGVGVHLTFSLRWKSWAESTCHSDGCAVTHPVLYYVYLLTQLWVDNWVVSSLGLLLIVLLWTFLYMSWWTDVCVSLGLALLAMVLPDF